MNSKTLRDKKALKLQYYQKVYKNVCAHKFTPRKVMQSEKPSLTQSVALPMFKSGTYSWFYQNKVEIVKNESC